MIQKKICMLGSFAVGKTSLVQRFVQNIFSEKYHTTIGVKVDKKLVKVGEQELSLILWDIAGEDGYHVIRSSYLRGASGYLLVVDKTRRNTLDVALEVNVKAQEALGNVPHLLLLNKWDLDGKWDIDEATIGELIKNGWDVVKTSAKTGLGVEEAFIKLATRMIG